MEYDPYNKNNPEYEYPLSRGIRKYGSEEYELIILENNVPKELLNERERYWIRYYDTCFKGYNQTLGGTAPSIPTFNEEIIDIVIELLQDESFSYQDIKDRTGISFTHISNINQGKRRPRDDINYPIRAANTKGTRGLKFSPEECKKIHERILDNDKTFKELGEEFGCSSSTISDIHLGRVKAYRLEGYNYPLRNNPISISKTIYWNNK